MASASSALPATSPTKKSRKRPVVIGAVVVGAVAGLAAYALAFAAEGVQAVLGADDESALAGVRVITITGESEIPEVLIDGEVAVVVDPVADLRCSGKGRGLRVVAVVLCCHVALGLGAGGRGAGRRTTTSGWPRRTISRWR